MTEIITRADLVTLAREYQAVAGDPKRFAAVDALYCADRLADGVFRWDEQERAALLAGQVAARDRAEQAIVRLQGDAAVRS